MKFLKRLNGKPNVFGNRKRELAPVLRTEDMDLSKLLARSPRKIDQRAARRLISGKRVLITGAGGTIGSELARQVVAFEPASLVLVDNAEFNIYQIDLEMHENGHNEKITPSLTDVCNHEHLNLLFCLLYTSPSPRDQRGSRMPSSA